MTEHEAVYEKQFVRNLRRYSSLKEIIRKKVAPDKERRLLILWNKIDMTEESKKTKIPILILCFAIFIIAASSWWFIQLALNPKCLFNKMNIFYSFTKFGVLVAGIGLIKMRKWGVYLYGAVYIITVMSFFQSPEYQKFSEQIPPTFIGGLFMIFTSLLSILFFRYWKMFK